MHKFRKGTRVLFWKAEYPSGGVPTGSTSSTPIRTLVVGFIGPPAECDCCMNVKHKGENAYARIADIVTPIPKKATEEQIQALRAVYAQD